VRGEFGKAGSADSLLKSAAAWREGAPAYNGGSIVRPALSTGVVLRCHDIAPSMAAREVLRLIDAAPVLDAPLLSLARWIANYYCAPLGEVLRGMLPLAADIRSGKIYSLTDAGRDAARQLLLDASPEDPVAAVLHALDNRPLSAAYLTKKLPLGDKAIRSLERKGFIMAEQVQTDRDPLRAPPEKLRVELAGRPAEGKLPKAERELLAFLEMPLAASAESIVT
jgi:primosomal protein N' (replication factor Y)